MTWEETIQFIRTRPEYNDLVKFAYFEEDLPLNVERFKNSEEFEETRSLISNYITYGSNTFLLDIGSGNGVSAIAFAIDKLNVDAVEPDISDTIGAGAINKLKDFYAIENIKVHIGYAEELKFPNNHFDIVYARQCMHHANDLTRFVKECFRVLKIGGILLTVRDHVIFDAQDKKWFLETHPLQKFYGGENAFTALEYKKAMTDAGFEIQKELKYYDSVINFFPMKRNEKELLGDKRKTLMDNIVTRKLGVLSNITVLNKLATQYISKKWGDLYDEKTISGRMYSFLAVKRK